ncbi:hypothetical protein CDL12_22974 [Handroanthus impetiginosus]|uniref:Uncharacterized protein n=1 Tax=Handroanthus impetiginosus TaxID=429701 RepID=A0A2G9GGT4_9LAMI|nr:hypothetical protein CDL12_22974 [Handroanthus impetiginosus]
MQEKSLDQDDCSRVEQIEHLEKEIENQSLTGALTQDTKESTSVVEESPVEKVIDSLQETTHEKILNTEGIFSNDTEENMTDLPYKNDENPESIATTTLYDDSQGDLVIQSDSSTMEHEEHSKKESENPSMTEIATKETNEDDSRNIPEPKNRNDDVINTELLENDKYMKEETCLEKPTDLSQVDTKDIDESDSNKDTRMSSIEEQILAGNLQEIPSHKIEGKTIDVAEMEEKILEDIAANVPTGETRHNLPIEEDGSQKPCLEEASTLNVNEDESTIMHEVQYVDESSTKIELLENDKNIEDNLEKEEVSIKSLQVTVENIKASASIQDKEISSLEEQSVNINCQEIIGEHNEDKISNAIGGKEETPEDKNVATSVPYEDAEKPSLNEGDCLRMEHNEHLEKKSEIPSFTETPTEKTNDDEPKNIHELEYRDEDLITTELLENENCIESTLGKEETQVEKCINSVQVSSEDIKASDSSQDTKLGSIQEQILIVETQEISGRKIEKRTIDATDLREDILEDTATNVLDGDNESDSLIKEDDSQKTYSDEGKFVDESSIKDGLLENKENIEDTSVKKVVYEDTKAFDSVQDIETSSLKEQTLAADCQGIIGDNTEEKTDDATSIKGQKPVDENVSTTIPFEDREKKSQEQDDHLQMEHHKNESQILSEAPTGDTEKRNLIIKEVEVEKHVDTLLVASEDSEHIKATASCQNKKTSCIEEQILSTNPQEISCDITEEKTTNATNMDEETVEVQNVATTISHEETEENSLNQVDCPQMEQKEHLDEESENLSSLTKASTEDNMEKTLVKEEPQVEKPIDSFQVANENIEASTSGPNLETSSIEEKIQTTGPQELLDGNIEEKSIDAICNKEQTLEEMATNVSNRDNEDSLPIKVDEPQKPSFEDASTGNATDYEPTIMHHARFADENLIKADLFENEKNTEDILAKEEVCIESVQVAAEDIKFSTLGQDREISSLEEQGPPPNPQAITGDHKVDKTIDETKQKEETPEDKNVATTVPQEDTEKNSIIQVDCSQMEYEKHLGEESENPSSTKAPTVKEEINEDAKPAASSQDMKINSLEEMILTEDSQETSRDNTEEKTIVATGTEEETLEVQVSREIENVDIKAKTTDLNGEEDYVRDIEMTTAVIIAAHEKQVSDSSAIKIPSVNKDIMVDIVDPKCKQEVSSIWNVSEEHINISKNVADVTILASEASELSGDHQVIEEANSCSDMTDAVKIGVRDDGSITVPSNENLVQIVAKESTDPEAQVRAGEKEVKLIEQEPEPGIDQKKIEEELPVSAPHDASKPNGMNGEEDNRSSDYGNEISESSHSAELQEVSSSNVASEQLSTSDLFQESTRVTKQEAVSEETQKQDEGLHVLAPIIVALDELSTSNPLQESIEVTKQEAIHEEVQKQDDDLHVSAPISDSSVENIKKDVQLCLTSAHVSDITQGIQKLDEAAGPSAEEKIEEIIAKMDCKESEVVEDSTQDKYIEHQEQDDTTKSFLDDKKLAESEQKEEECTGEKGSTSVPVANTVPPTSSMEPPEDEKELRADTTESAVSLEDDLINSRSIVDLKTKIDDEAPEITETTTTTGGQETESRSVGESPVLISQCEKDDHEHVSVGNMIEDKSDSNAVQFEHEENKSINESKNQVLDSIAQVQSCDIISKAEETKTHEHNLEATIEINSVAEDISEPKEIMKVDISSNKIKKEDEDVEDYHLGSCMDEVITTNSQEDEVKQEEMINTEEILDEVIKHANDTEKVPKVSEEISSSNVASEELSTSELFQESTRVTEQEALSEEAQRQDKDLTNIEKDVELCLTSVHVSDVTQEIQKLEEASVENLEQDDTTKSFSDDKKLTEIEQEEKECKGEKEFTSVPVANTFPPTSSMEALEAEKKLKADATESAISLEDNLINSRSIVDLESKIDDQASEITDTAPTVTEGQETESRNVGETSVLISQCEKDEHGHVPFGSVIEEKSDSNKVEFAHEETKRVNQSKNQVLESSAQVQSCDIISKAEEAKTDEENHEAAIEINSVADDRSEPKKIIEIKREDEDVEDYHFGSCTEGVITKNHQEDAVKQEGKINTEEILDEVLTNANDTEKLPKVSAETDDKAMVEPEDNLLANESIYRSFHLEEYRKSAEEFITPSDIKQAQVLDHIHTKTETEDSTTEFNSSSEAFLEDGDNRKGADGIDNESKKDEVLLNQNTNTSVLDSAARSKRHHENIIRDAAPTKTVQKTVEETEDKKECTNTIMMEQQHEDNINKNKSLPLPEFAPGKESEKQDQKDEICSSHEVQVKDEENQMLSAGKNKEEAREANIWSKPGEDEDRKTYANAERLEFLADAKNALEVSHSDGAAQSIPEDNENSTTINECSEEKYQNKSTESLVSTVSKDIELIEEGSNGTRIAAETQEIEAQSFSSVVPEQMGVDSQQVEELRAECKGMTKTSISIQPSKISTLEIILDNKVGSSSEAKDQLTELHSLLQESRDMGSEVKLARRDGPVDLQKVTNVRDDVQKLKEGFVEVLNKKNPVEANPNENVEATISSEGHEAEAIQKALTSETFEPEIQERQPGRTCEAVIEAKASHHQSSMENATQSVENKESQRQEEQVATSRPAKAKNATLEADHTINVNPENSLGNKNISVIQHESPAEYPQGEGEDEMLKPSKCEQEVAHCGQETTKSETYDHSLPDILPVSMKESSQMAYHFAIEKESIIHTKDLQEEKADNTELADAKTDEEKEEEEESSEQRRLDLGSDAPVMVKGGDGDVKVTHKKSHNILSGVGSKVKHSIAKVKKAITGKSSHPKPSSPKEGEKHSKTVVI